MESFAPCLGVNGAVFIAISTFTDEDNYLTQLIKNDDPASKRMFGSRSIELWCSECKSAGIPASTCNELGHTDDMMVSWKSSRNNEQVQRLMPQSELMKSEVYGLSRGRTTLFEAKMIDKLMSAEHQINLPRGSVDEVCTWVDPSGGGSQSDLVFVSVTELRNGNYVVTGMSSDRNMSFLDEDRVCIGHFQSVRNHGATFKSTLVQFGENNYGGASTVTRMMSHAARYPPCISTYGVTGKPGVTTTAMTKEESVMLGHELLTEGKIFFLKDWASTAKPKDRPAIMTELAAQLKRFRKKVVPKGKGTFGYEWTGKEGKTGKDDLAFGLFSCIYWLQKHKAQKEHTEFMRNRAMRMSSGS